MPFTGGQFWAVQQAAQNHHIPSQYQSQLNPSVPGFQPNGYEMQRFQARLPTPPPDDAVTSGNMMQMRNLMLEQHFSYTKEVAGLERKTKNNSDEIKSIQEIVRNDMRTLQDQIESLKSDLELQKQQAGMITGSLQTDEHLMPPEFFTRNWSKGAIAKAYLDQAGDYERTAAKLRAQAEVLCPTNKQNNSVKLKLLECLNGTSVAETKARFFCCYDEFASVEEMLEHLKNAHDFYPQKGQEQTEAVMTNGRYSDTPAHLPSLDTEDEKQDKGTQAIEIKAPEPSDEKMPNDKEVKQANEDTPKWTPYVVREMPPTQAINVEEKETFTFDLITQILNGEEWSPGFYYISKSTRRHFQKQLPFNCYWLLEEDTEPFLPSAPGLHGAKLTAFFNNSEEGEGPEERDFDHVPVFIRPKGRSEYVYYGTYSQPRFSDKLDIEHMLQHVPESVRQYHAEQLASPGRSEWLTQALLEHFWPLPTYKGPIPTDSMVSTPATDGTKQSECSDVFESHVIQYAKDLRDHEKQRRADLLTLGPKDMLDKFMKPDADDPPGLRLWFEYLKFEGYDEGMQNFLTKCKKDPKKYTKNVLPVAEQKDVGGMMMVSATKWKVNKRQMSNGWPDTEPVPGTTEPGDDTVPATSSAETAKPVKSPGKKKNKQGGEATSPRAKANGDAKPHTGGQKPWEKKEGEANMPNGDIKAAKKLQEEFKSRGKGKHGNGKNGEHYRPPHQRREQK